MAENNQNKAKKYIKLIVEADEKYYRIELPFEEGRWIDVVGVQYGDHYFTPTHLPPRKFLDKLDTILGAAIVNKDQLANITKIIQDSVNLFYYRRQRFLEDITFTTTDKAFTAHIEDSLNCPVSIDAD